MREMRSYGSVRGATRESRPYRDPDCNSSWLKWQECFCGSLIKVCLDHQ